MRVNRIGNLFSHNSAAEAEDTSTKNNSTYNKFTQLCVSCFPGSMMRIGCALKVLEKWYVDGDGLKYIRTPQKTKSKEGVSREVHTMSHSKHHYYLHLHSQHDIPIQIQYLPTF